MAFVHNRLLATGLAALGTMLLVGCSALLGASPGATVSPSATATTTPSASASPAPRPSPATPTPSALPSGQAGPTQVANPAQAAALVLASDPRFAAVSSLAPGLIGASAWYEASLGMDGTYSVTVTLGSGDCQSGCIDQHTWTFAVTPSGSVSLVADEGDAVDYQPPAPTSGPASVRFTVGAGPTCPVQRYPSDPACAQLQVLDAQLVVHSPDGGIVARATTDATGTATLALSGGAYWVEAMPVQGLMGTPPAQAFSVVSGHSVSVVFGFDTGIR
jgi:hypothetical protein